jgi:hypothetical protein
VTTGALSSTMSRLLHRSESSRLIGRSNTITAGKVDSRATWREASAVFSPQPSSELDVCKPATHKTMITRPPDETLIIANSLYYYFVVYYNFACGSIWV